MASTERQIKALVDAQMPFFLVVNKIDRLILELKLPPADAYFKLKHTIEEVNSVLSTCSDIRVSPEAGNVCFAAANMGYCFSLLSFAAKYAQSCPEGFDHALFARRLWGDIYFDVEERNFKRQTCETAPKRTFIHFILEPMYKLYTQILGEEPNDLKHSLSLVGIHMKKSELIVDVKPLMAKVFRKFFGSFAGFVSMCVENIPSPVENAAAKIERIYTGPLDGKYGQALRDCDPKGPLMIQIVKMYNANNVTSFEAFGRIFSGTLKLNQLVRVLGEAYSPDDDEDMCAKDVSGISIYESRYKVKMSQLGPGNFVLIGGVDASILKTATITDSNEDEDEPVYIFKPLRFTSQPVMKIAVEPVNPTELPKMLDGLRKVNKSYCVLQTKVEESGEHILLGPGEMYLDCAMHDLRCLYAEIDIKIADPVVKFCETVIETSSLKCFAETPNKKNKLTMICEPLEKGIAQDIENSRVNIKWPQKKLGSFFVENYSWDILASRNVWAFGPDDTSPNVLVNDTLPSEVVNINTDGQKNALFYQRLDQAGIPVGHARGPVGRRTYFLLTKRSAMQSSGSSKQLLQTSLYTAAVGRSFRHHAGYATRLFSCRHRA